MAALIPFLPEPRRQAVLEEALAQVEYGVNISLIDKAMKWVSLFPAIPLPQQEWEIEQIVNDVVEYGKSDPGNVMQANVLARALPLLPLEKRGLPHLNATNDSWHVDETCIKVKKVWMYLYRAVDSRGEHLRISAQFYQKCASSQTLLRESACRGSYQRSSRHYG